MRDKPGATWSKKSPMDGDRKYRQPGYQDSDRSGFKERRGDERPRAPGPKLPLDITGPRLPRLVQAVTAARCFNCSTQLPAGIDWNGNCPKCNTPLHCCKQCAHFELVTRFQCLKPIPVRIPVKDKANDCALFSPRVTVARDGSAAAPPPSPIVEAPTSPDAARSAFDKLFKK